MSYTEEEKQVAGILLELDELFLKERRHQFPKWASKRKRSVPGEDPPTFLLPPPPKKTDGEKVSCQDNPIPFPSSEPESKLPPERPSLPPKTPKPLLKNPKQLRKRVDEGSKKMSGTVKPQRVFLNLKEEESEEEKQRKQQLAHQSIRDHVPVGPAEPVDHHHHQCRYVSHAAPTAVVKWPFFNLNVSPEELENLQQKAAMSAEARRKRRLEMKRKRSLEMNRKKLRASTTAATTTATTSVMVQGPS